MLECSGDSAQDSRASLVLLRGIGLRVVILTGDLTKLHPLIVEQCTVVKLQIHELDLKRGLAGFGSCFPAGRRNIRFCGFRITLTEFVEEAIHEERPAHILFEGRSVIASTSLREEVLRALLSEPAVKDQTAFTDVAVLSWWRT